MTALARPLLLTLARRRRRIAALALGGLVDPVVLSRLELHRMAVRGFRNRPALAARFAADHIRSLLATGQPEAALAVAQDQGSHTDPRLALSLALIDAKAALKAYAGADEALKAGLLAAGGREDEALTLAARTAGAPARLLEASLRRRSPEAAAVAWRAAFSEFGLSAPEPLDPLLPVSVVNARADVREPCVDGDLVSVVMPARNASRWVGAAVRSVLDQGWRNLEFLFVDDASTDETVAAASAAAEGDSRFRVISLPRRRGAYGARNAALREARGRWVAFQDADEWAHPDRLAVQIGAMKQAGAAASTARGIRVDAEGSLQARGLHPLSRWAPSTLMIDRQAVLVRAGVFDEVLSGADNEYWWRLVLLFGPSRTLMLRRPLILGAWRSDSLTGAADSGFGHRGYNLDRLRYWEGWSLWHLRNAQTLGNLRLAGGERPFRISETLRV